MQCIVLIVVISMTRSTLKNCAVQLNYEYIFVFSQVALSSAVSRQVISEFRSLTDICDVLSSLDIAIGFLSSTGGAPDRLLSNYLGRVLRMQENTLRSLKVYIIATTQVKFVH